MSSILADDDLDGGVLIGQLEHISCLNEDSIQEGHAHMQDQGEHSARQSTSFWDPNVSQAAYMPPRLPFSSVYQGLGQGLAPSVQSMTPQATSWPAMSQQYQSTYFMPWNQYQQIPVAFTPYQHHPGHANNPMLDAWYAPAGSQSLGHPFSQPVKSRMSGPFAALADPPEYGSHQLPQRPQHVPQSADSLRSTHGFHQLPQRQRLSTQVASSAVQDSALKKASSQVPAKSHHTSKLKRSVAPEPTAYYFSQADARPQSTAYANPLLIILDLNGTLGYRNNNNSKFTSRSGLAEFLAHLLDNYKVMIWTSARPHNMSWMLKSIFSPAQQKSLVATWARDTLGLTKVDYNEKVQVYKDLHNVWDSDEIQATHPYAAHGLRWDQSNTLLVDDSESKAAAQPFNLVRVPEFDAKMRLSEAEFEHIGHRGILAQVRDYVMECRYSSNVSSYMRHYPFVSVTWTLNTVVGQTTIPKTKKSQSKTMAKATQPLGKSKSEPKAKPKPNQRNPDSSTDSDPPSPPSYHVQTRSRGPAQLTSGETIKDVPIPPSYPLDTQCLAPLAQDLQTPHLTPPPQHSESTQSPQWKKPLATKTGTPQEKRKARAEWRAFQEEIAKLQAEQRK